MWLRTVSFYFPLVLNLALSLGKVRLTSSRKIMTPPGGQNRREFARNKALNARFIRCDCYVFCRNIENPEIALMKISVPESKGPSSSGGDNMSAMRILMPLLMRSCTSGFFADEGRMRAVTSCFGG